MTAARVSWIMVMFLAVQGVAAPADQCSCDPAAQTQLLRQRLESLDRKSVV